MNFSSYSRSIVADIFPLQTYWISHAHGFSPHIAQRSLRTGPTMLWILGFPICASGPSKYSTSKKKSKKSLALWDVGCKGHEERPTKIRNTIKSTEREREEAITATQERPMETMKSVGVQKTNAGSANKYDDQWYSQPKHRKEYVRESLVKLGAPNWNAQHYAAPSSWNSTHTQIRIGLSLSENKGYRDTPKISWFVTHFQRTQHWNEVS